MKKTLLLLLLLLTFNLNVFAQLPAYVPTLGLVAYYPFAGNANDASGNNNHAVVTGASLTSDRFSNNNEAYSFNGSSNFMSVSLSSTLTTNWTISGWYLIEGGGNYNTYYAISLSGSPNANGFGFGGTAHTCYPSKYGYYDGGTCGGCCAGNSLHGATPQSHTNWMHIVLIKSAASYSFYYNGVLDNSANLSSTVSIDNFFIGKRSDNILYYKGKMDDIGIWDRALNPSEVTALFYGPTANVTQLDKNNASFNVFPNPANSILNVSIDQSIKNQNYFIYDYSGKLITKGIVGYSDIKIDISSLSEGNYILQIGNEKKQFTKVLKD